MRHCPGKTRRRPRRTRRQLTARARPDRQDRPRSRLPRHRPAPRARPRIRQGSLQARRVRPHLRRRRRGLAELDRHRPAPLRRIPRPAGRVRPPRADRTRQRNPDGTPLHRRETARLRCCASGHASTTANSSTSPPRSSTATASSQSDRRLPCRRRPRRRNTASGSALAVDDEPAGELRVTGTDPDVATKNRQVAKIAVTGSLTRSAADSAMRAALRRTRGIGGAPDRWSDTPQPRSIGRIMSASAVMASLVLRNEDHCRRW